MAKKPRLIVISAPSGAGKTTLCQLLLENFKDVQLSTSATTRPIRPDETDGVHYFFLTKEAFIKKREANEFVEWAEVHDNLYGTPKSSVDEALSNGKHVLFDIDVQGAKRIQEIYSDTALLIFIHPPSMEELADRLKKRAGDSPEAIERRLKNSYNEVEWSRIFQYHITNDDLKRAFQELRVIIQTECK